MEIKSDRITLREMTETDWANYVSHVTGDGEVFIQYGLEPEPDLLDYIQSPTPEVIYRSIILNDTNEMVGHMGIATYNDNLEFYTFKEHRNNKYCSEALPLFIQAYLDGHLDNKLHDVVVAETLSVNEASIHVLEKAGFTKEAIGFRGLLPEDDEESTVKNIVMLRRYEYKK